MQTPLLCERDLKINDINFARARLKGLLLHSSEILVRHSTTLVEWRLLKMEVVENGGKIENIIFL
jgi:hypothetical protein